MAEAAVQAQATQTQATESGRPLVEVRNGT